MQQNLQQNRYYPKYISSGQSSLRTTDLKEDKQAYKSKTFGGSEVLTKFTLSFQSAKNPGLQSCCSAIHVLLCHHHLHIQGIWTSYSHYYKFQPARREIRKARVPSLSKRTSQKFHKHFSFHYSECKYSSLTLKYNRGWKIHFIDQHQLG